ncbi:hypothetical protein CEXT_349471 [Caerostris extrusa]|uniref:Uncharacterized protein n=1 Tax=Caerostris extrusa TaxID=172846 RepID=A0AAV4RA29_CAEEX|nr:hypothetical protein CEXT_349471 [Caerostris extrusa]
MNSFKIREAERGLKQRNDISPGIAFTGAPFIARHKLFYFQGNMNSVCNLAGIPDAFYRRQIANNFCPRLNFYRFRFRSEICACAKFECGRKW